MRTCPDPRLSFGEARTMKKMLNIVVLTLAMNFLLVAGGVGWLYQSKHLDRERVTAIKQILFPNAVDAEATTRPSDG